MIRTIDRYLIRETLSPFILALVVFTFILQIPPVMEEAKKLLEKGVDAWTILKILGTLLPQALGITIPVALLVGLLISLGRLSADREAVALQACGVSLPRLLRPVMVVALLGWGITTYVMLESIPAGNRKYQQIIHDLISAKVETNVKPRVFFEDFPNLVLYARDVPRGGGGWKQLFLSDTRQQNEPLILMANRGRMIMDPKKQQVDLLLEDGSQHRPDKDDPGKYRVEHFKRHTIVLDPATVFPKSSALHGPAEMTIPELKAEIEVAKKEGRSPHNLIMAIQQKFSIPVACLVFGLLALGLGVSNRKDGKQASFVIGLAVVFVYWSLMYIGQSMAKAHMVDAHIAMWIPDIVLGVVGLGLLLWRHKFGESSFQITIPSWSAIRQRLPFIGSKAGAYGEVAIDDASDLSAVGTTSPSAAPAAAAGARRTGAKAKKGKVLVIRVPQGILPKFRILDSYVGLLYLRVFALTFLGLLGIFYIATFIDLSDKLFKGSATGTQLVLFLWYSSPQFIYYLLPLSALVSTLVTIGLLTKSSELIVMRACGISLYRVAVPVLALGFVWSGALFGLEESILAQSNRQAEQLKHIMRGGSPRTFDVMNRQWIASEDGKLYHYSYFDPRLNVLSGLSIYEFDDLGWRIKKRTQVHQAAYANHQWIADKGWTRTFENKADASVYTPFAKQTLPLEPVSYFATEQPDAERMSFSDLKKYIGSLRTSGFDVVPYTVALHRKVSFPFVAVVMTLIGVPFAVTTGRRGALYGIGIGIALAICYWGLFILFTAIGSAGMLTPVLAAWAPNVLFLTVASYLMLTVRT
jgi:LPS export ABC transporter permease LptG/LPS export ABC transporter permease LptF